MSGGPIIRRVREIAIEGLRGFTTRRALDVDADVVILSGSNGFGKTSLVDALNLALNGGDGSHGERYDPRMPYNLVHAGRDEGSVRLAGDTGGEVRSLLAVARSTRANSRDDVTLCWDRPTDPDGPSAALPATALGPEVAALASVFYQDRLEIGLDGVAAVLCRRLPEYAEIATYLKQARQGLEAERWRLGTSRVEDAGDIERDRLAAARAFRDAWRAAAEHVTRWPAGDPLDAGGHLRSDWTAVLRRLANDLAAMQAVEDPPLDASASAADALRLLRSGVAAARAAAADASGPRSPAGASAARLRELDDDLEIAPIAAAAPADGDAVLLPLTPEAVERVEALLREAEERERDLRRTAEALAEVSRRYRAGTGPDLVVILSALAAHAEAWSAPLPDLPAELVERFPAELVEWLRVVLPEAPSLAARLTGWLDEVAALERRVAVEAWNLHQRLARQRAVLAAGRTLLGAEHAELRAELAKRSRLAVGDLRARLESAAGEEAAARGGTAGRALEAVRDAVGRWQKVEERASARALRVAQLPGLRAQADVLDAALAAIDVVAGERAGAGALFDALRVPAREIGHLEQAVRELLGRFRLVDAIRRPAIKDDRPSGRRGPGQTLRLSVTGASSSRADREHLSTGQQTQVALSLTLALNLLLADSLGHRVILLDDVSTSLDMAQLPRVAILLRQLAYANEPAHRRQIFIASHHEDLTNRLLDFLLPPPGRSLKVVQFEGWTKTGGPEMTIYEADGAAPSPGFEARLRDLIGAGLGVLRDPFTGGALASRVSRDPTRHRGSPDGESA